MKNLKLFCLITAVMIFSFSGITLSQTIIKSSDIKIKTPVKQNWEYKFDGSILNIKQQPQFRTSLTPF